MNKPVQRHSIAFLLFALLFAACGGSGSGKVPPPDFHADNKEATRVAAVSDEAPTPSDSCAIVSPSSSTLSARFDSLGLVNIAKLDSTIAVSLIYATPNNFVGEVMYDDLTEAYLHPEAAVALLKAQQLLKAKHAGYTLIVYDATRPMSAQRKMWNIVKGTSKSIYVSNPARGGGLHNYGLAVDVSILDASGTPLPMGTEVDHLGREAHTTNEAQMVKNGVITAQEKENRELLRCVMRGAGFRALHSEWWHFNLYSREVARKSYRLIE